MRHRLWAGWRAVLCGVAGLLAVVCHACRDATTPLGQGGPVEMGPQAGEYIVGEFVFHDSCVQPVFSLTGTKATVRTAVFDFIPSTDHEGEVVLTGSFEVVDPTPGAPAIMIFEGPDTGHYRVLGDTLRLGFGNRLNAWVGIIPFTLFRGGVLHGGSDRRCSALVLRLERRH